MNETEALWILCLAVAVYFLPLIIALHRSHHNFGAIAALNVFLGWTGLGWLVALVWSVTHLPAVASVVAAPTKRCPMCAEDVKAAAIKCKHCGSAL
jgi:Superinfection immunity protein